VIADKALAQIESPQFFAHVNLASGHKLFKQFLLAFPAVMDLLALIDDSAVASKVFDRAKELIATPCEGDYAHSWDSAIAAYCWLLTANTSDYARRLASDILKTPGFWWAKKIATEVKGTKSFQHASSDSIGWNRVYAVEFAQGGSQRSSRVHIMPAAGSAITGRDQTGTIRRWQAPGLAKVG
jgi:hypothetical protein